MNAAKNIVTPCPLPRHGSGCTTFFTRNSEIHVDPNGVCTLYHSQSSVSYPPDHADLTWLRFAGRMVKGPDGIYIPLPGTVRIGNRLCFIDENGQEIITSKVILIFPPQDVIASSRDPARSAPPSIYCI